MTYWATLWYAGSVVLTLGSEGQTLNDCNQLGQVMMYDIATAYVDPTRAAELEASVFPQQICLVSLARHNACPR
jgi:hypothetical protein